MAEDTYFQGTVPKSFDTTNVRDAIYRAARMSVPIEVVASNNPTSSDTPGWAGATGYYYGGSPYTAGPDSMVIPVQGRKHHSVQVTSTQASSFSVQVEGSLDGVTWSALQSAWTTAGVYNFGANVNFIRFNVSALSLTGGYDNTIPYGLRILYIGTVD